MLATVGPVGRSNEAGAQRRITVDLGPVERLTLRTHLLEHSTPISGECVWADARVVR
jgi:hypothetical protein